MVVLVETLDLPDNNKGTGCNLFSVLLFSVSKGFCRILKNPEAAYYNSCDTNSCVLLQWLSKRGLACYRCCGNLNSDSCWLLEVKSEKRCFNVIFCIYLANANVILKLLKAQSMLPMGCIKRAFMFSWAGNGERGWNLGLPAAIFYVFLQLMRAVTYCSPSLH